MKEIEKIAFFYPLVTGENNPLLRDHCKEVETFDQEIQDFATILIELMYYYEGVGLAAPQL
ncbi:peptide deformylase [bacterium]|nr:peptide deformylase [bacterium]